MWRYGCAAVLAVAPVGASADFVPMDGDAITEALTDQTLTYAAATQTFYASGRTLYDAGRPSWGYWRIENDRYCSQWPPSDLWACYDMARDGDALRVIADDGSVTDGVLSR